MKSLISVAEQPSLISTRLCPLDHIKFNITNIVNHLQVVYVSVVTFCLILID